MTHEEKLTALFAKLAAATYNKLVADGPELYAPQVYIDGGKVERVRLTTMVSILQDTPGHDGNISLPTREGHVELRTSIRGGERGRFPIRKDGTLNYTGIAEFLLRNAVSEYKYWRAIHDQHERRRIEKANWLHVDAYIASRGIKPANGFRVSPSTTEAAPLYIEVRLLLAPVTAEEADRVLAGLRALGVVP